MTRNGESARFAAGSAILNALWIGVVQLGWLGASVVVMLLLLLVLARIFMLMRPLIKQLHRALDHGP